mmetsp:Transcript_40158/g.125301  ORF Transcript_40158/g.125301 Transcript_40158/m.125301 type:complete len:231 (-) Transcript_40158:23-715(-)
MLHGLLVPLLLLRVLLHVAPVRLAGHQTAEGSGRVLLDVGVLLPVTELLLTQVDEATRHDVTQAIELVDRRGCERVVLNLELLCVHAVLDGHLAVCESRQPLELRLGRLLLLLLGLGPCSRLLGLLCSSRCLLRLPLLLGLGRRSRLRGGRSGLGGARGGSAGLGARRRCGLGLGRRSCGLWRVGRVPLRPGWHHRWPPRSAPRRHPNGPGAAPGGGRRPASLGLAAQAA